MFALEGGAVGVVVLLLRPVSARSPLLFRKISGKSVYCEDCEHSLFVFVFFRSLPWFFFNVCFFSVLYKKIEMILSCQFPVKKS